MSEPAAPSRSLRTFLALWATQSLSVIGTALTYFAVNIWLIQVLYPRPDQARALAFALAANGLAFALPTVVLAPIAGAFADRHDRRRIMLVTDAGGIALGVLLATRLAFGAPGLAEVLAIMTLYCALGTFHGAAFESSLPMIVSAEQLPRANAMMQSMWALAGLVAPALAASLIALPALARRGVIGGTIGASLARLGTGVPFAIAADACSFVIAGAALLRLAIPSPVRADLAAGAGVSLWQDVRAGVRYIAHRSPLLWLLGTFATANLLFTPIAIVMPLLVKFTLAPDWRAHGWTFEGALAALSTAHSVGGLAGAAVLSAWGGLRRRRVLGVLGGIALGGFSLVALGAAPTLMAACAAAVFAGATLPAANVHSQAIWQTQVPPELQGRVFSVRRLIAQFTFPLGTAMGGVIAGVVAPAVATMLLGGGAVAFAVLQAFNPALRRVEDKAWLDAMAERRGRASAADPSSGGAA